VYTITWTGAGTPDAGWTFCEGQQLSRTGNPGIFSRYGTFYGAGNGSTTFNIPDIRGRVVAHQDNGAGRLTVGWGGGMPSNSFGAVGGEAAHAITVQELIAHQHHLTNVATGASIQDLNHDHGVINVDEADAPQNNRDAGGIGGIVRSKTNRDKQTAKADLTNHGHYVNGDTDLYGGSQQHNNVQPTIVLCAQMKLG